MNSIFILIGDNIKLIKTVCLVVSRKTKQELLTSVH